MSPGINDGPRYTGTVPKSNRRNDRNRERSNSNQILTRSIDHRDVLHQPNNLRAWHLVTDPHRSEKNSNTLSTSSAPSIGYQDPTDFECGSQQRNYASEERSQWQRMAPPAPDSHAPSPPPPSQGSKPTNVDKMPDRGQVESRLNQIRDYIRVTSTMMDSLSQSGDPRAITQHEKLSKMVEDLYDSETKLAKLLETYQNRGITDESGDNPVQRSDQMRRFSDLMDLLTLQERFILTNPNCMNGEGDEHGHGDREAQLHRKVEETQRKLAQLQEQEASLLGMQLRARERLNEARQAQQVFLQQGEQQGHWEGSERQGHSQPDQLETEHAALRGKLVQLQNKKKRMDHLVAELQAVDSSDRGSCSSEGSRAVGRDKVAELDAMKAQLVHLKALMKEATRDRHTSDSEGDGEAEEEVQAEPPVNSSRNSIDRQSDPDDSLRRKSRNSTERPTVDQVQAVTRELKEQSVLLQAARAELQRLKQTTPTPLPVLTTSTPPPSLLGLSISEKKQSNNNTNNNSHDERCELQLAQAKRRQLEELMRKEQGHSSSVNQDVGGGDWNGPRETNSQLSHTSVTANLWPLPAPTGAESNDQSVDGISTSENLPDVGPNANMTALNGNWWGVPPPLGVVEQPQQAGVVGTAEYYRQLLLGSQAQQLQMMGMTMQQCCQLLWAQQRELQSMRAAIVQLQLQLRQQPQQQHQVQQQQVRANNNYNNTGNTEEYSNLSRAIHQNGSSLDTNLPPSSSLPNLVALPTPAQVPALNPPHQQQQQLNNQVPPGNRANNYWDNFRSYSRQNLLSVNGKTTSDRNPHTTPSTPATNTVSSAPSTASGSGSNPGITSRKDKRNREHGLENSSLPTLLASEMQNPQNIQMQSNFQQQEAVHPRNSLSNVLANDMAQQQSQHGDNFFDEQQSPCARLIPASNDGQVCMRHLSDEMSDAVTALVTVNTSRPGYLVRVLREVKIICEDHRLRPRLLRSLRALRDSHSPNNPLVGWLQNETTDQTASESCQSSDDDSDTGTLNNAGTNAANQAIGALSLLSPPLPPPPLPLPLLPVVPAFESGGFQAEGVNVDASASITPGYNEDLAEADQSRPEASHNHQIVSEENIGEEGGDSSAASANALIADLVAEMETFDDEGERNEDLGLDRVPTRLYHQANESA